MDLHIRPPAALKGEVRPPGDKSISHRAAIIASLAEGHSEISGFLEGEDCLSTVSCLRSLGVELEGPRNGFLRVYGRGLRGFKEPDDVLNAGNSGTTMRLLLGLLAGQPFYSVLTGDASLRRRPMGRVAEPLRSMGAKIYGRRGGEVAPLTVLGGELKPLSYTTPVASAQLKSALLLAGLYAEGETVISEPALSRDHTERLLGFCGAELKRDGLTVFLKGRPRLKPFRLEVPGDISAAAFFLVAGCIHPQAEITIENVGLNPTRSGVLDVLRGMGAEILISREGEKEGEPTGKILVRTSRLRGYNIKGEIIPRLIDEIPVLAVAAAVAEGETVIRDAAELRVKESDRIAALTRELRRLGAHIEPLPDGMIIRGGELHGAEVDSHGDHRLAMALAVAGLVARGETVVRGAECIAISYPDFCRDLASIGGLG
ncbi:MAG: 3-phosphoshikimate 1-carboxyvinyltransferase [Clostridia bacterium]|nr:3-phosphoshikimate 1-carboxyvinyltransferase [Clostridia bacterium]